MGIFKRGNVYWYHFLFNGEHIQKSTKQGNPRTARQMEAAYRTALAKGEVGITERKPVPTLADYIENRFTPWARATFEQASPKTWTGWYRTQLANISGYRPLVSRKLDSITSEHAADYAAYLQTKGWQPSSVNSSLRVLRRALRLAVEWGITPAAPKIKLLRGEHHREQVVHQKRKRGIWQRQGELMADIATVLIDTGMRPEENSRLRWESIGWSNGHMRNASGDTRQDGGGAPNASHESACTGAARTALGSSEDALRGLGMGDGDGKRTHRAFHSEETAPAGAEAQWSASLRALRSPAYVPHAAWGSGLRRLDAGTDRRTLFDRHVRPVRSSQRRCSPQRFSSV